ncbi:MAG: hypothetical protein QXO60_00080 [Candidatus Micrarchaeia archaeon]
MKKKRKEDLDRGVNMKKTTGHSACVKTYRYNDGKPRKKQSIDKSKEDDDTLREKIKSIVIELAKEKGNTYNS